MFLSKQKQYLEYGSLPQQAFGQVLPWQLSGGLQLLVPVSSLRAAKKSAQDGQELQDATHLH